MRPFALLLAMLYAPVALAQQADTLPARFQPLTKNDRFKLVRILGNPELHPAYGATTAFSADGKRAIYVEDLSSGPEDKPTLRSRLVIVETGAKSWPREIELPGMTVSALDLSADGRTVLLAGLTIPGKAEHPHPFLCVWNLDTGNQVGKTFLTEERPIHAVALSPNGHEAVTGTRENLKIWNLKTGKEIMHFGEKDKTSTTMLAWLPDGKQFLAGFLGGEVRLFDAKDDKHLRSYRSKGEQEFVWHLAVTPDGKRFASSDLASSVSVWETETGKEIGTFRPDKRTVEEFINGIALAPDGRTVYVAWGKAMPEPDDFAHGKLYAWDASANKVRWSDVAGYRGRTPMRVVGVELQVGGGPNPLDFWDRERGKKNGTLGAHLGPVNVVAILPNGDLLSGGPEGSLLTWSKGAIADRSASHPAPITALALHPGGDMWFSGGADRVIRHWPPDASRPLTFAKKHTAGITSLAVAAKSELVVSGSTDRSVRVWFTPSGEEIAVLTGHSEGVNAVAMAPDERWIASGSDDGSIRLWPIKAGKPDPDREVIVLEEHKKPVTCLAFSKDGKTLVSGSQDQTVKVWDLAQHKCRRTLTGHKNWISSVTLVDDRTALTTSDDLTVCFWDLESGRELGQIDLGLVGDCPRCLALRGDRVVVGSSSWLIYEFQLLPANKTKSGGGSSK